ncbi:hypothetical protein [Microbispora sp. CA-102843]|uniref:poly(ethylene terephthalate) hydrolase family protein n=1 Tax=Microbispora sp. CA-102843 TaxID=3239952 RepID=UPI003D8F2887
MRPRRPRAGILAGIVAVLLVIAGLVAGPSAASAADNPYERGPSPTAASIAADRGPFTTAQVTVPRGNGFGGGVIYYPTDTSQGTFGAIAIAPGFGTAWSYYAWQGPRLASFGFVVIGIETNTLTTTPPPGPPSCSPPWTTWSTAARCVTGSTAAGWRWADTRLDVSGAGTAYGSKVEIWTCHGGTDQKWTRT